jgi:glutamyl-tRNA synthetase
VGRIRVRVAPAPTGKLHLGTAHTSLFNFLFARHNKGEFILRIDDSDQARSKKEYEKDIIEGLRWLGIEWDEGIEVGGLCGPYRQSERVGLYQKYIDKLLAEGKAYFCYCTPQELEEERREMAEKKLPPKYSGRCRNLTKKQIDQFEREGRKPAVRFKTPQKLVCFVDLIRGKVEVDTSLFGDFIIARSDGTALLNLAATIDDIEMKITHALRGEDFLNLVPRQLLLFEALKFKPPEFGHFSFIYAPDGTKLSKRHGATAVSEYRTLGYLPETIINYLAILGWSPGDDREFFTMEDLIYDFTLERVLKSGPAFDLKKLDWYNGYYIRKLSVDELTECLGPFIPQTWGRNLVKKIVPLEQERLVRLADFATLADFFFKEKLEYDKKLLLQKGKTEKETKKILTLFISHFSFLTSDQWKHRRLEELGRALIAQTSWSSRDLFMALRIAITGRTATPPLFETMEILGREKTLERIKNAIKKLK